MISIREYIEYLHDVEGTHHCCDPDVCEEAKCQQIVGGGFLSYDGAEPEICGMSVQPHSIYCCVHEGD